MFPGETLKFDLWKNGNSVIFNGSTLERGKDTIFGEVELSGTPEPKL